MGFQPFPVASLQVNNPVRHDDDLVIGVSLLGGLIALPGKDDLDLEFVSRALEDSCYIGWLHR